MKTETYFQDKLISDKSYNECLMNLNKNKKIHLEDIFLSLESLEGDMKKIEKRNLIETIINFDFQDFEHIDDSLKNEDFIFSKSNIFIFQFFIYLVFSLLYIFLTYLFEIDTFSIKNILLFMLFTIITQFILEYFFKYQRFKRLGLI